MKRNGRSTLALVCLTTACCSGISAFAIVVLTAATRRVRHMLRERTTRLRACSTEQTNLVPMPTLGHHSLKQLQENTVVASGCIAVLTVAGGIVCYSGGEIQCVYPKSLAEQYLGQ